MFSSFSRRTFARLLGGSTAALSLTGGGVRIASAQRGHLEHDARSFPPGFLWGSATASYQVEGAVHEDGRGASVWDTFAHTPGRVHDGDTGDVADDFYHRYKDDVSLMKDMGLKSFRFSVAWSRIFPDGTGQPNAAGVDFYSKLVDALLEAGIQPFCTMYHWDLPQALQDKGGWENRDTAQAFAAYAGFFAGKLSDRVKHFMTMNELRSFVELGYQDGTHAPGLKVGPKGVAQVSHHAVLGHGLAVQAIRAHAKAGTRVGIADNLTAVTPAFDTREHVEAARKAIREENAMFLTVIQEGRYTDAYLERLGPNAPKTTPEEMKIIASPMDFTGINIYQASFVRAADTPKGYAMLEPPASYPRMFSPWLYVGPEALYWVPRLMTEIWKVKEIYVTENGASSSDRLMPDGQVYDTDRVMFLRNYLTQLQRAVAEGIPVKGYFLWSLLDNFEWADGYEKRFGITYVDFQTQKRTPKLSAAFFKKVIADNRVA